MVNWLVEFRCGVVGGRLRVGFGKSSDIELGSGGKRYRFCFGEVGLDSREGFS